MICRKILSPPQWHKVNRTKKRDSYVQVGAQFCEVPTVPISRNIALKSCWSNSGSPGKPLALQSIRIWIHNNPLPDLYMKLWWPKGQCWLQLRLRCFKVREPSTHIKSHAKVQMKDTDSAPRIPTSTNCAFSKTLKLSVRNSSPDPEYNLSELHIKGRGRQNSYRHLRKARLQSITVSQT